MENEMLIKAVVLHKSEMTSLSFSSAMLNWVSMESQPQDLSFTNNQLRDCFFCEKSTEQSIFDSALSSLVSSPTPSNSHLSGGENFVIRELIGKLDNIAEIYGIPASNENVSASTPISSPPQIRMIVTKPASLVEFSGDPRFSERAANLNGRTNSPLTNEKLTRFSSSPALKPVTFAGETSRKRKAKSKQNSPSKASQSEIEEKEDSDAKRIKNQKKMNVTKITFMSELGEVKPHIVTVSQNEFEEKKISERMKLLQDLSLDATR